MPGMLRSGGSVHDSDIGVTQHAAVYRGIFCISLAVFNLITYIISIYTKVHVSKAKAKAFGIKANPNITVKEQWSSGRVSDSYGLTETFRPQATFSKLIANILCAQANSASYPQQCVGYMGWPTGSWYVALSQGIVVSAVVA